jgi:vacuolar-type H+-ATPase subunit H
MNSSLSHLLERLRRLAPPPGAAAAAIAVPSRGDGRAREVEFLFTSLDAIEERRSQLIAEARSQAAEQERVAAIDAAALLTQARVDAERLAAEDLHHRRIETRRRARALLDEAEREAAQVLTRAGQRTPALVQTVVERLLEAPQ